MADLFDQFLQFGIELEQTFKELFNSAPKNQIIRDQSSSSASFEKLIQHHHRGPPISYSVKLAGLSGGVAVAFAAYGAHFVNDNPNLSAERRRAMQYANLHHFLNSIGMILAVLASKRPKLTAALFATGTLLFCGPSYAYAIAADKTFRTLTPVGGVISMIAWFSFIF